LLRPDFRARRPKPRQLASQKIASDRSGGHLILRNVILVKASAPRRLHGGSEVCSGSNVEADSAVEAVHDDARAERLRLSAEKWGCHRHLARRVIVAEYSRPNLT